MAATTRLRLGASTLTRIGLGTNRLTNTAANVEFVRDAATAGVSMIDTAHTYTGGESKPVVDGLMETGDTGHFDASGRLFVDGRDDDMIVSGGENVFPREVEDLLSEHPAVADAAVVGVPDHEFGQRLKAFVVLRDGDPATEAAVARELQDHVRARLARFKVPREVVFVAELPRTTTGKVVRPGAPP